MIPDELDEKNKAAYEDAQRRAEILANELEDHGITNPRGYIEDLEAWIREHGDPGHLTHYKKIRDAITLDELIQNNMVNIANVVQNEDASLAWDDNEFRTRIREDKIGRVVEQMVYDRVGGREQ